MSSLSHSCVHLQSLLRVKYACSLSYYYVPCRFDSPFEINDKDEPYSYPLWIVSVSGPFLFTSAIIHAALWKPWSSIFGAIVSDYSS